MTREEREELNGHKGCVVWFTGLSAAARARWPTWSTTSCTRSGRPQLRLDGDNVRHGLNAGPAMLEDRTATSLPSGSGWVFPPRIARRTSAASAPWPKLFCEAGIIALTAFISPYRSTATACGRCWPTAISSRSSSMPRWRSARHAIQGALQEGPGRRDQGLHRHRRPLRGARESRTGARRRHQDGRGLADEVIAYLKSAGIVPAPTVPSRRKSFIISCVYYAKNGPPLERNLAEPSDYGSRSSQITRPCQIAGRDSPDRAAGPCTHTPTFSNLRKRAVLTRTL